MPTFIHSIAVASLLTGAAAAGEPDASAREGRLDPVLEERERADVEPAIRFDEIDTNADEVIDLQELQESYRVHAERNSKQGVSSDAATETAGMQVSAEQDESIVARNEENEDSARRGDMQQQDVASPHEGQQAFREADQDGDKHLTPEEAEAAGHDYVVMYFEPLDVNRDGYLDEDEWAMNSQDFHGSDFDPSEFENDK